MPNGADASGVLKGQPAGVQDDCIECPGGSYCLNATITPQPCGVGFYTKPGQSVCQVSARKVFITFNKINPKSNTCFVYYNFTPPLIDNRQKKKEVTDY